MDRDTPAETMRDMAAVHPRLITARYGLDARGDRELQPQLDGDIKVFDLESSIIRWTILPGITVDAVAFNGQVPGPRIRVREGDRVRINVTNRLPEHDRALAWPHFAECHGRPAKITQEPIEKGQVYRYEFTVVQSGTYFYHSRA